MLLLKVLIGFQLLKIGDYLSKHLVLNNEHLIYDISFDAEKDIWIIQGATDKSAFDRRENLYVTVYNMDSSIHSSLEFTDTKQGNFYTQWIAPTDPGLYIVQLQYHDSKATQIVHVEKEFDYQYVDSNLNMIDLAREFEELQSFAKEFGGTNFDSNPRFASVVNEIKSGFTGADSKRVSNDLDEFKLIIERYLPIRNPTAPIEASYDGDKLVVSGCVLKLVEFSEDLFIDIYNQKGNLVKEIILKDDPTGLFTEIISQPFDSGMYVVQLQYQNLIVTDFFNVK